MIDLTFNQTPISFPDELKELEKCKSLVKLEIKDSNLVDRAFAKSANLSQIIQLSLYHNKEFTDTGVGYICRSMPNIRKLDLSGTGITNQAIESLNKFKQLSYMRITNTQITDSGIKTLSSPSLAKLDLRYTSVTANGIRALLKNNKTIQTLSLSDSISDQDFYDIARTFKVDCKR